MNHENWERIKELAADASELPASERAALIDAEPDEAIRREVGSLLDALDRADDFIEQPVAGILAEDVGDPLVGSEIAGFRLKSVIGAGGMGTVYLAERETSDFNQKVALKVVKRGMDSELVLERFVRERRILSTLDHPNIARLVDGGISADGRPFFVMEFVDGLPLGQYCESRNPGVAERLRIFRQICDAVDHAHRNLVVHRDLKPSNVIVTADGVPKLLDFGIAKLLGDDDSGDARTMTGLRILTPEYASPEQLRGGNVTTATDVYSLGVILFEMLSGRRPFETHGKSLEAIVSSVCDSEPPRPSQVASTSPTATAEGKTYLPAPAESLSGDLDNIILKALRREPDERYGSASRLSDDIGRFLDGRPVLARPQTLRYRLGKYVRRHRVGVGAGVVVGILLAGAFSVAAWQSIVARRERALAEERFGQVRKFANTVLFDYHDRIRELPGATAVREKMVRDSLEYLDQLAARSDNSVDLQRDLAQAYRRVGDVTGDLGNSQGALESYRKALSIAESVAAGGGAGLEDRRLVGNLYLDLADKVQGSGDLNGGRELAQKAVAIFDGIGADFPDQSKPRSDSARAIWTLAGMARIAGDLDQASELFRRSLEIYGRLAADNPGERRFTRNMALTYKNLGGISEQKRDYESALEIYRKALEIDVRNAADEPLNVTSQMDLSFSYGSVSTASFNLGRYAEAEASLLLKKDVQEKVVAADPKNAFAANALGFTYRGLAYGARQSGKLAAAIGYCDKSVEIFRRLTAADATNVNARVRLAETLSTLGKYLLATGRASDARRHHEEALAILTDVGKSAPNDSSAAQAMIQALAYYGATLAASGQPEDGIRKIRESLEKLDSTTDPGNSGDIRAEILVYLGDAELAAGDKAKAIESYRRCLALWRELEATGKFAIPSLDSKLDAEKKLAKLGEAVK